MTNEDGENYRNAGAWGVASLMGTYPGYHGHHTARGYYPWIFSCCWRNSTAAWVVDGEEI